MRTGILREESGNQEAKQQSSRAWRLRVICDENLTSASQAISHGGINSQDLGFYSQQSPVKI